MPIVAACAFLVKASPMLTVDQIKLATRLADWQAIFRFWQVNETPATSARNISQHPSMVTFSRRSVASMISDLNPDDGNSRRVSKPDLAAPGGASVLNTRLDASAGFSTTTDLGHRPSPPGLRSVVPAPGEGDKDVGRTGSTRLRDCHATGVVGDRDQSGGLVDDDRLTRPVTPITAKEPTS